METVIFFVAAAAVLLGALGVVIARNPVHSALLLVVTLVGVAVFFVLQRADLLAAVQIIVYASAIVVLFLFVIMLLGVDRSETLIESIKGQRAAALLIGALVLVEVLVLAGHTWATGQHSSLAPVNGKPNVETVARALFTHYLWAFEITAVLLVIAVVGAVSLARRSHLRSEDEDEPAESTEPGSPSDGRAPGTQPEEVAS